MTVECEEFEYCKVKVHYTADPELVEEKRDEAVAALKKAKVKVSGFRPGKASAMAIKSKYKKQINKMVEKELVSEAYDETLFETKMKPIFHPEVHDTFLDGNNFTCNMTFLKKPEFELKQYTGFIIPNPHVEMNVTEACEKMLQQLREQHGDVIPYGEDDFVQDGDQVTLDIKASVAGETLDSLTKEGILYVLGQNTLKEIDEKLYGMKAGEEKEFDIIFEDKDNLAEEVKGKRVRFNVKIHMGTKKVPMPLDDSLAEKIGYKNYAELRTAAEGAASSQFEQAKNNKVTSQVISRLLSEHDFEVPLWLVLMESQNFAMSKKLDWDNLTEEQIDEINARSRDQIKLSLILDSVRENEPEAVFSDQEMVNKISAQLTATGQNANAILSRMSKEGTLMGAVAALKDEATMQWLINQSNIIEEEEE